LFSALKRKEKKPHSSTDTLAEMKKKEGGKRQSEKKIFNSGQIDTEDAKKRERERNSEDNDTRIHTLKITTNKKIKEIETTGFYLVRNVCFFLCILLQLFIYPQC